MKHAKMRALERYGLNLSPYELRQIAKDIALERGIMLGRTDGIERWLVKVKETAIKVVFAPKTCKIITILPLGTKPATRATNGGRRRRKGARHR